jgi:hypothetical protein
VSNDDRNDECRALASMCDDERKAFSSMSMWMSKCKKFSSSSVDERTMLDRMSDDEGR